MQVVVYVCCPDSSGKKQELMCQEVHRHIQERPAIRQCLSKEWSIRIISSTSRLQVRSLGMMFNSFESRAKQDFGSLNAVGRAFKATAAHLLPGECHPGGERPSLQKATCCALCCTYGVYCAAICITNLVQIANHTICKESLWTSLKCLGIPETQISIGYILL